MSDDGKNHIYQPKHLDAPDETALKSIGDILKRNREGRKLSLAKVAALANVNPDVLAAIENDGQIYMGLGVFRQILLKGYGVSLEDVMEKYCKLLEQSKSLKRDAVTSRERPFNRDFHYSFFAKPGGGYDKTPTLRGGDPKSYVWAVPLRKLAGHSVAMELLELAPLRKKINAGRMAAGSHDGLEIMHVISGNVSVEIDIGPRGPACRELSARDSICINAGREHCVRNTDSNMPAFLMIVRHPSTSLGRKAGKPGATARRKAAGRSTK